MGEGVVNLTDLDFRFGWRWLLPLSDNERVVLIGFTDHEVAFWKQAQLNAAVVDDAATATVLLVQDEPLGGFSRFDSDHLYTICVIGLGAVVASWRKWMAGHFVDKRDYALLPPGSPRVVVPLGFPTGRCRHWHCIDPVGALQGGWLHCLRCWHGWVSVCFCAHANCALQANLSTLYPGVPGKLD